MPQPGKGDYWPTRDDERAATGSKAERPVADQAEQASTSGGWFDSATPAEPAGRDEPHASRASSLQYEEPRAPKVTWPVAELAKQAESARSSDTGQGFVFRPAQEEPPAAESQKTTELEVSESDDGHPDEDGDEPDSPPADHAAETLPPGGDKTAEFEVQPQPEDERDDQPEDEPEDDGPAEDDGSAENEAPAEDDEQPEPVPDDREAEAHQQPTGGWPDAGSDAEPEPEPDPEPESSSAEKTSFIPRPATLTRQEATTSFMFRPTPPDQKPTSDSDQSSRDRTEHAAGTDHQTTSSWSAALGRAAGTDRQSPSDGQSHHLALPTRQSSADRSSAPDGQSPDQPTSLDRQPSDRPSAPDGQSPDRSTPLDRQSSDRPSAPDGQLSDRSIPLDRQSSDRPTSLDRQSSDRSTSLDRQSPDRPSALDRQSSDRSTPLDRQSSDRSTSLDRQSSDRSTSLDRQSSDRSTSLDRQSSDRSTSLDRQSPDRSTPLDRPAPPDRQSSAERVTSFDRPVPPRRPSTPSQRADEATAFMAPVPQDQPPSFLRHPANHDEATVFIARPPKNDDPLKRDDAFKRDDPLKRENPAKRDSEWPPPEPPRAAPKRVGPEPEADAPATEKKTRRPLLIAAIAIVAVIAVAAGVVFGVPGLSEKLGLTGEPAVAIEPPPGPVTFQPGLTAPDAGAPAPTPQGVTAALDGPIADAGLGNVTGVVIDPATGEALYERSGGEALTPASTGKLLTAAAVLLTFGHADQLVTKVVEGESPGEAIIVGGGDSTLSSLQVGSTSMYPGAAHLSQLVDKVKESGAQVQTVYIDQDRYSDDNMAPGWLPADVGSGYITPIVPAMLDGGRADATVNYSPRTNNPGGVLVDEFAARIGATAPESAEKKAPEGAKVLGEVRSAPMSQLVDNMLDHSDNVLAESLAHELAIKIGKEPSFAGSSEATLEVLRKNEFDVEGVVWKDASGLSGEDRVSAKLLAQILAVAAAPDGEDPRTAKLRPLLGGLPVAGGSGTLADRYDQPDTTDARGWVRAKTGSLTGVNSLAGIVLDKDNRPLVFAFLTSGTTSTTARPALDRVTAALRGCGCQ